MLIREIILENFMSYEYARIPIKPGLNLICGPNGAGKSSILLAISVALGQAYTERSRKLSDLIRWGKDSARVTLGFDNTPKRGRRPVPRFDTDYFRISRYMKKDGTYWFEINFKIYNKSEVTAILNQFGINPDNMLIIMHQRMMEEFSMTNPVQRLKMVEEAVGLGQYRSNILEAEDKLTQVLSEEESVRSLLENSKQTLAYWKEEYDKLQKRNEILQSKNFLGRELIWAQIDRQESLVNSWKEKIEKKEEGLVDTTSKINKTKAIIQDLEKELNILRMNQQKSFYSLITWEKERAEHQSMLKIGGGTLQKLQEIYSSNKSLAVLNNYVNELTSNISYSKNILKELDAKITTLQPQFAKFDEKINQVITNYIDERVRRGILKFQKETLERELEYLTIELKNARKEFERLQPLRENAGSPIDTLRSLQEISDDIKIASIQLSTMGEISSDVEKMYLNYLNVFNDLKEKIVVVSENRVKALQEVGERKRIWKNIVNSLLNEVSLTFEKFLLKISASGNIRLGDTRDIEETGLELNVGFKGAEPAILDSYTQSGGERSTATMAFLLALQQFVKSPLRAVDEFDIHMDPRNREIIYGMLHKEIKDNKQIQYLTITPGQITDIDKNVHVITVQNIGGRSEVKVVE